VASLTFALARSMSLNAKTTSTSTTTPVPLPPTTSTVPGGGYKETLGTNSPAVGDCTTNASAAATSGGFVVQEMTASSFLVEIQLRAGAPNTTHGVMMQQVPG
jgi:hypothetical protein